MPRSDKPPMTRGVVLRGIGLVVAVALGAVAVWLIATNDERKMIDYGVLAGLWSALIGAFAVFGTRRATETESAEVARRDARTAVERAADLGARRDFEERLQQLLRREIDSAVTREVSVLRTEITQLRQDLVEKVGGQLRLERIEVTRVIGSDLEALQQEVRQLKSEPRRVQLVEPPPETPKAVQPARTRPVERSDPPAAPPVTEPLAAEPPPVRVAPAAQMPPVVRAPLRTPPPRVPPPERVPPQERVAPPERVPPPEHAPPERVAPAGETHESAVAAEEHRPPAAASGDPFASLPRITPFTEFALDPIEDTPPPDDYSGRRRRRDPVVPRHAERDAVPSDEATLAPDGSGRRRRADEATDDSLLARLLSREGVRH